MNGKNKDSGAGAGDDMINRYLLGEASAEEQTRIESRYFTDPEFMDEVIAAEDDLIDAYARGQLTGRERQLFEARFMASPDRRGRVLAAQALLTHVGEIRRPQATTPRPRFGWLTEFFQSRPALQLAVAALLIIAVAATGWLIVENRRLRSELSRNQEEIIARDQRQRELEQQLAARDNRRESLAEETPQQPATDDAQAQATAGRQTSVASAVLVPGLVRDVGQVKQVVIPPGAQTLRVQLSVEVKGEYRNLRSLLRDGRGNEVWSRASLKMQQVGGSRSIVLMIPAGLLAAGPYTITLSGTGPDGATEVLDDYPFAVARR
jgi:hypothetical protein